jgi:hypothetical protein
MRLRQLQLPVAVMHPEFLMSIEQYDDLFDHVSPDSIETGYHLQAQIFDAHGNKYLVDAVVIMPYSFLRGLTARGKRVDLQLRLVASYAAEGLRECFQSHLNDHPTWLMNYESVWTSLAPEQLFGSGTTTKDVIQQIGLFSAEIP